MPARLIPTQSEEHALDFLGDLVVPHHVFLHVIHIGFVMPSTATTSSTSLYYYGADGHSQ